MPKYSISISKEINELIHFCMEKEGMNRDQAIAYLIKIGYSSIYRKQKKWIKLLVKDNRDLTNRALIILKSKKLSIEEKEFIKHFDELTPTMPGQPTFRDFLKALEQKMDKEKEKDIRNSLIQHLEMYESEITRREHKKRFKFF